jgi:DMSO/TMAO reductase YedYZ molybdopterin-dependent catalytic subunit
MPQQAADATEQSQAAPRNRGRGRAAFAGIASAAAGVGAAELTALVLAPRASPLFAAGSLIVDVAPPWLKEAVIGIFGTADKTVIIASVALIVVILAALAGVLEHSSPPSGRVLLAAIGGLGLVAAVTRADASPASAAPSLVAMVVGVLMLAVLIRQSAAIGSAVPTEPEAREGVSRRSFLVTSGLALGLGVLTAVAARVTASGIQAVDAVRRAFTLPVPAVAAPPVPPGASLEVAGISPLVTANADFYRIDTALLVPSVDPATWSLRVIGMVEREVALTFDELLALPLEESYTTLACVSNPVGGNLIGNARWLGYPLRHLLARAVPKPGADMVLSRSVDGFTAGTPLSALMDDRNAILAVAMNGEPLPPEHGFPVRMVVPGLYGYVSATKWVTELKVTTFAEDAAYWTHHGWSARGPVKLSSRIDSPRGSAKAGNVAIAGVAWSQHTGVSRVEVQIDDGRWLVAELAEAISVDTWRQWSLMWDAPAGRHTVTVRATDANGVLQDARVRDVVPDGATGYHSILIDVS